MDSSSVGMERNVKISGDHRDEKGDSNQEKSFITWISLYVVNTCNKINFTDVHLYQHLSSGNLDPERGTSEKMMQKKNAQIPVEGPGYDCKGV